MRTDRDLGTAARLRLALEAAGMGSFMWYPLEDRTEPDARLLDLFGLPADGSISLEVALARLIHPDDADRYRDAVLAATDPAGEGRLDEEIRVALDDGARRWVRVVGRTTFEGEPAQPVRMAGVAIDVTDRRVDTERQEALAARFGYQVALADELRPLARSEDIKAAASRLIASRLGADRALYSDISDDGLEAVVDDCFVQPGVTPIAGRFAVEAFGPTLIEEVRAGRTLVVDDTETDERLNEQERMAYRQLSTRSAVAVPLVKGGRLTAVLGVQMCSPRSFTPDEVQLVEDTAERTWAAVETAAAEAALRVSEERFRSIANTSPTVIWTTDDRGEITFLNARWTEYAGEATAGTLEPFLHPDDVGPALDAWREALRSGEDFQFELRFRRGDGMYRWFLSRAVAERDGDGRIIQWLGTATDIDDQKRLEGRLRDDEAAERRARERAELVNELLAALESVDTVEDAADLLVHTLVPNVADRASVLADDGRTITADDGRAGRDEGLRLAVPLGEFAGQLVLRRASAWDDDVVEFVRDLAQRVGLVLENARLHDDARQVAVRLQRALLPTLDVDDPHLTIESRYESASNVTVVGGDWFDAIELPDGRIGLVVGDVVGHGLDAAVAMGRMRVALAAFAADTPDPGAVLERVDRFAAGSEGVPMTTACYAVVDPAAGTITYASAGHPPLLLVTPGGEVRWLDEARSPLLGLAVRSSRRSATSELPEGSAVVMYSDGLVERRDESIDVGLARLARAATDLAGLPEWAICDRLFGEMGVEDRRDDDVVVMVARYNVDAADRFHRRFKADTSELAPLRSDLRGWLADRGVGAETVNDVLLAIGEACTNSVEHAYLGRPQGDVDVVVALVDGAIHARIRDFGVWRPPRRTGPGGRGITLIDRMSEELVHETASSSGTRVSFRIPATG